MGRDKGRVWEVLFEKVAVVDDMKAVGEKKEYDDGRLPPPLTTEVGVCGSGRLR